MKLRFRRLLSAALQSTDRGISRKIFRCLIVSLATMVCEFSWAGVDLGYERDSRLDTKISRVGKALGAGRSYALLVGISSYQNGFSSLPTTSNDVEKMRKFLLDVAGFDTVKVLTDEKVTRSRVDALMVDYFPSKLTDKDRFIFYWSGHGTARSLSNGRVEGYLPLPTSVRGAFSSMISMDDLRRWDDLLSARQTLFILDSCMSGLAGHQAKSDAAALTVEQLNRPSRHLLVAGAAGEEAIAGDRWGGAYLPTPL